MMNEIERVREEVAGEVWLDDDKKVKMALATLDQNKLVYRIISEVRKAWRKHRRKGRIDTLGVRIALEPMNSLGESWLGDHLSNLGAYREDLRPSVCRREFAWSNDPMGVYDSIVREDPVTGKPERVLVNVCTAEKLELARRLFLFGVNDIDSVMLEEKRRYYGLDEDLPCLKVILNGEEMAMVMIGVVTANVELEGICSRAGMQEAERWFMDYIVADVKRENYVLGQEVLKFEIVR